MRRLHTGVILLDSLDIICISVFTGSSAAYIYKTYRNYRRRKNLQDPLVIELQQKSKLLTTSKIKANKALKATMKGIRLRGGDKAIRGFSLVIKNKKLARLMQALAAIKENQKRLFIVKKFFFILNGLLTAGTGLRFAGGGALDFTQIILIAFPSTLGGVFMGLIQDHPIIPVFLPILVLFGRGIENIPDPYEKCRMWCQIAEEYHNRELRLEMRKLGTVLEEASEALQLPLDKQPLLCVEEKLSLVQRFRLKTIRKKLESKEGKKRIKYFSEFIKQFPECDPEPEDVFTAIME